jgi:hypothetical protein
MRNRLRRQPQVESLEAKTLLSGTSAAAGGVPSTMTRQVGLRVQGTVAGTYHAREIPDAGKTYDFSGRGSVSPLGHVDMTGHVQLPGLLFLPVGIKPSAPVAFGQVVLSGPAGSLTLSLTAPSSDNAMKLPDVFRYQIAGASGTFEGDAGSGELKIIVTPAPSSSAAASNLATERGTFKLVFVPTPSATGNTAS